MHPSQVPEKPLTASINTKLPPPTEVYFIERENGEVLHVDEKMAWNLLNGRSVVVGRLPDRMKLIGTGKGEIFQEAVLESQAIYQKEGLQAAQERIRKGVQDELEACRGTIKYPRNHDTVGAGGAPVNINDLR
jgi:hypothetical protein